MGWETPCGPLRFCSLNATIERVLQPVTSQTAADLTPTLICLLCYYHGRLQNPDHSTNRYIGTGVSHE